MKNISIENKKFTLLFIICLIFSILFSTILSRQSSVLIRSDHFSRWYAVNKLVTEQRSIYDPQNGREVVALNSIPVDPIEGSFFYPAHLIIFFLPIAKLPYYFAHFIWIIINQLFLIIGIFGIYKETHWPHSINQFSILVLLSIIFIPNLQNTIWGQYNTIGVISLMFIFMTLRREKYFLSGLITIGLTFKPQNYLLILLFLVLWALLQRKRWNFILGFAISCFVFWLLAEHYESNWVISFLRGVQNYNVYLKPHAVLNTQPLLYWLFASVLIFVLGYFLINNFRSPPTNSAFTGCLVLSLGIWWIIVPVVGMMYLVAMPIVIIMIFPLLENQFPKLYKLGTIGLLILYGFGFVGFIYGLSNPGLYGIHIQLAELAYKVIMPFLIIGLTIPLCISKTPMRF